ncbi:uncharacterized protein DEA37_0011032 [Paragonimus westermani]|uniref:TAR DNA-binding protein 43 N-terminal domain-containing protein n=1 Tax=Paragonimus westermani TaxID=34504 RepID=A0A5J4NWQ6_9TREM|nr:uncharacterized protein DEA37_0011032 [Paragonimus westermani]
MAVTEVPKDVSHSFVTMGDHMDGVHYIRVSEDEDESPIEVPIESDGTVLLTTLNGVFPKATGLKYLAPESADKKRKGEEDQDSLSAKSKKVEGRKCTDLIVLNLAWKTDEATLRDYFSRYGDLVLVQLEGDKQEVSRKVHVGGISDTMTSEGLERFFSQFGKPCVSEVQIPVASEACVCRPSAA